MVEQFAFVETLTVSLPGRVWDGVSQSVWVTSPKRAAIFLIQYIHYLFMNLLWMHIKNVFSWLYI